MCCTSEIVHNERQSLCPSNSCGGMCTMGYKTASLSCTPLGGDIIYIKSKNQIWIQEYEQSTLQIQNIATALKSFHEENEVFRDSTSSPTSKQLTWLSRLFHLETTSPISRKDGNW